MFNILYSLLSSVVFGAVLVVVVRKSPAIWRALPIPCVRHDWATCADTAIKVRDEGWIWRGKKSYYYSALAAQVCTKCGKFRTRLIKEFHHV